MGKLIISYLFSSCKGRSLLLVCTHLVGSLVKPLTLASPLCKVAFNHLPPNFISISQSFVKIKPSFFYLDIFQNCLHFTICNSLKIFGVRGGPVFCGDHENTKTKTLLGAKKPDKRVEEERSKKRERESFLYVVFICFL
jgi:hypothetical protein